MWQQEKSKGTLAPKIKNIPLERQVVGSNNNIDHNNSLLFLNFNNFFKKLKIIQ